MKHNYTASQLGWGHSIHCTPQDSEGKVFSVIGHGRDIEVGHFIILSWRDGDTSQYKVTEIEYKRDPSDMFTGTIEFAPRTDDEKLADMQAGIR